jgi:predicted nucleic acid-binding protein
LIAFDTNILVYAEALDDPLQRHTKSRSLLAQATLLDAIIPLQVFAELSNVCKRKNIVKPIELAARIAEYEAFFETPGNDMRDILLASTIAAQLNLQYFDALIIVVADRAGATMLLSEDMHDGLKVGGLKIINPFVAANETLLADYFAGFP